MNEKMCYIIGAGEMYGMPKPTEGDLVIAADGGYDSCQKLGITPHTLIGDFDSMESTDEVPDSIRLPRVKDDTDTLAAVKLGLERGFLKFAIFGGTGGRIDHTIANIQTILYLLSHGARCWLVSDGSLVTGICDDSLKFGKEYKGYISVFALGGTAEGVFEKGLKYALNNATLTTDFPVGISNEFVNADSEVSVKKGTLLIVYPDLGEFK